MNVSPELPQSTQPDSRHTINGFLAISNTELHVLLDYANANAQDTQGVHCLPRKQGITAELTRRGFLTRHAEPYTGMTLYRLSEDGELILELLGRKEPTP